MFLIIGIWGGKRRIYAGFKFFLYTLLGSVLMLLAIMAMYLARRHDRHPELLTHFKFAPDVQTWLWLAFFASFAVKMPMWPVHTWLPDAHVEAPTAGSVILAAHPAEDGRLRLHALLAADVPGRLADFAPLVFALSVDRHRLHLAGRVDAGGHQEADRLFVGRPHGLRDHGHLLRQRRRASQGAMFQMISHGIVSGALFLCVGVVYDRMHTREIAAYGGLVNRMPLYAAVFMVFTMANVGLPGTSGFVGEFLTLIGAFQANTWVAFFATIGVILSAGLCAVALSPRDLRRARRSRSLKAHPRSRPARDADPRAAGRARHLFGVYPAPMLDAFAALDATAADAIPDGARRPRRRRRSSLRLRSAMNPTLAASRLRPGLCRRSILAVGALALLLVGAFRGERSTRMRQHRRARRCSPRRLSSLVADAAVRAHRGAFDGAFVVDAFARFMKVLTLVGSAAASCCRSTTCARERIDRFEFPILILLATSA